MSDTNPIPEKERCKILGPCPKCGGEFGVKQSRYECTQCGHRYNDYFTPIPIPDTPAPENTNPTPDPVPFDTVNHPPHYTFGQYEVIDVIEDWELDYHRGNAVKYIARAKHKGNEIQDLQKAVWYLNRAIEKAQKKENDG